MDKDLILTTQTTIRTIVVSDPGDEVESIRR
jgi:hypothetical protein